MSALARMRTEINKFDMSEYRKAQLESTWQESLREYRANIRECWLRQEISMCVRRLNVIRAMQVFERENDWHPAVFRREIARNNRLIKEHRAELAKLRSEA